MNHEIISDPLPYVASLKHRSPDAVDLVVIHCTELPDLETAREYGLRILHQDSGTGNSGHFYIDRDGRIEQWVCIERCAHHVRGFNERSIGIELVNRGRYPDWFDSRHQTMTEHYPAAQLDALRALLLHLQAGLNNLRWVVGHQELDTEKVPSSNDPQILVHRKRDPGECFPWEDLLSGIPLDRLPS